MQRERMLAANTTKLGELVSKIGTFEEVPSYERCRDLIDTKRADFEKKLINGKKNKFARDIADYEKGTIFSWKKTKPIGASGHNSKGPPKANNSVMHRENATVQPLPHTSKWELVDKSKKGKKNKNNNPSKNNNNSTKGDRVNNIHNKKHPYKEMGGHPATSGRNRLDNIGGGNIDSIQDNGRNRESIQLNMRRDTPNRADCDIPQSQRPPRTRSCVNAHPPQRVGEGGLDISNRTSGPTQDDDHPGDQAPVEFTIPTFNAFSLLGVDENDLTPSIVTQGTDRVQVPTEGKKDFLVRPPPAEKRKIDDTEESEEERGIGVKRGKKED